MDRRKELTRQIVVRVDDELYDLIERDAEHHGRTVAQSVRHTLRRHLDARHVTIGRSAAAH